MNTQSFIETLESHKEKIILFEYQIGKIVRANYHITEVKNVTIASVDCGAQQDNWQETIVQLWESPQEADKIGFMTGLKALGILSKVARAHAFVADAELKIEYSNPDFHTAQLYVREYSVVENKVIFHLSVENTDCKAKEICGIPEQEQTINQTEQQTSCCSPTSGCC